jgi:DNA repair protein RecO (recombination protein O)
MEETKNTAAIVLNRQPYRENDSLVSVYTLDFGKLNLIARGTSKTKSKLAGHLEPFSRVDIMIIRGRGLDYIGGASLADAYSGLREDLNKIFFAGQAISVFNRFVKENQADSGLFFLLVDWLELVNDYPVANFSRFNGELCLVFFELKMLAELGYSPELETCLSCHKKVVAGGNYFNLQNGGLVCGDCAKVAEAGPELLTISDDCIKLWRFMSDNALDIAPKLKLNHKLIKELSNLMKGFISFRD